MNPRLLVLVAILGACAQGGNPSTAQYTLQDSGSWDCGGNGGRFASLYRGTQYVDSIDIATGFQVIPDGLIITPVRSKNDGPLGIVVCPEEPILWHDEARRPLREFLRYFDPHFPVRTLVDSSLLYWGFVGTRAYATRFSLVSRAIDTTFLVEDSSLFETDNSFQFLPPLRVDSAYIYETATGLKFTLGRGFRVVPDSR